jgi:hypothetical protein
MRVVRQTAGQLAARCRKEHRAANPRIDLLGLVGPRPAEPERCKVETMEGGCTCRHVRYRLTGKPMIVHACHCRWCQRETGSVHALNAVYEADRVVPTAGDPEIIVTPSSSGKGQRIARCPICKVAVWSNYAGSGPAARFVRVGTLDNPELCPPDVHIFTAAKQPWVLIPAGAKAFAEFYELSEVWSPESLERRRQMRVKAGLGS